MQVPYLITNETICITFDHKPYYVYKHDTNGKENEKFNKIKTLIREKDFDKIKEIVLPKEHIIEKTTEYFVITDEGQVFMRDAMDEELPYTLSDRLVEFVEDEFPIEPLVNFWINLRLNETTGSKQSLYRFLEANKMSITEDGCFIAYKAVNYQTGDVFTQNAIKKFGSVMDMPQEVRDNIKLVDVYTRTINNSIGQTVGMLRKDVDHDPNHTCSAGLHVAAFEYAKHHYSGNVVIEVKVNPKDVVSVPYDYNNQKMRVCKYEAYDFITVAKENKLEEGEFENLYNGEEYKNTMNDLVEEEERYDMGYSEGYDDAYEGEYFNPADDDDNFYLGYEAGYSEGEYDKRIEKPDKDVIKKDVKDTIDLVEKTASSVVNLVEDLTGDKITFSLKSKKSIIRKAKELLEKNGYKVDTIKSINKRLLFKLKGG